MTRRKKQKDYHPGALRSLVEKVAKYAIEHRDQVEIMVRENDYSLLHTTIGANLPGYNDKSSCLNCGGSMEIAEYTAGLGEGLLLIAMANQVRHYVSKGLPFTEANKTHIPTLPTTDAIRHAITRASYLGLVAQPEGIKNSGYWVITSWGWKALRGDQIPRSAKWWRGKLIGRSTETTALGEMFRTHTDLVKRALEQRKKVKADHTDAISKYSPSEWVQFGGYVEDIKAGVKM